MNYPEQERLDGRYPTTEDSEPSDAIACAIELLASAKAAEARAVASRIKAEQAVLAFIPPKPEGSTTLKHGAWKVTATFGMNRTLDPALIETVRAEIPEALFEQAIEYKPSLVMAGLRYLIANEPETYSLLAQAITAKPAKPSVRLEPNKEP